jgi:hypothetical protein
MKQRFQKVRKTLAFGSKIDRSMTDKQHKAKVENIAWK